MPSFHLLTLFSKWCSAVSVPCHGLSPTRWPAVYSLLTLQISALIRNVAWVVPSPRRFLSMTLPSGIFFGTPFGGSQLLNVLLKSLPEFPIRGRWQRQLRKRTTCISNFPTTTHSRVVWTEYLSQKRTRTSTTNCANRIDSTPKCRSQNVVSP